MVPTKSSSSSSSPYSPAAQILNKMWLQHKGLKTIAYSQKGELICSKATYAQCCHVLKHKHVLDELVNHHCVDFEAKNQGLLYVLLYELLLGPNQSIRGGGVLKRTLTKRQDELKRALKLLEATKEDDEADDEHDDEQDDKNLHIPRYVRINTIQTTTKNVVTELANNLAADEIYADSHVPDVLVLRPTPENRSLLQDYVLSNQVVLQDKSSCFSAFCLVHGFEINGTSSGDYLDACAAPGNKTCHLAALLSSSPSSSASSSTSSSPSLEERTKANVLVHALDRSKDRFQILQRRMKELAPSKVICHQLDFLSTDQSTFPNVTRILLDPSCSGSGMSAHYEEKDPHFTNERVQALAKFQLKALTHAMTNFPKVNQIVYSTCSLYLQENESVVQQALAKHSSDWMVIAPICLQTWKRRGLPVEGLVSEQFQSLIRVDPSEDETNGFFVACFQRRINIDKKPIMGTKDQPKGRKEHWRLQLPNGLRRYKGQFRSSVTETGSSSRFLSAESINAQKRKQPGESYGSTTHQGDASAKKTKSNFPPKEPVLETNSGNPPALISKKRAKKLAWKHLQREEKLKRIGGHKRKKS